jgi:hypothetical protein
MREHFHQVLFLQWPAASGRNRRILVKAVNTVAPMIGAD